MGLLLERSELEMVEGDRERQANYKETESIHCFSLTLEEVLEAILTLIFICMSSVTHKLSSGDWHYLYM